jgi:hypothetical protein
MPAAITETAVMAVIIVTTIPTIIMAYLLGCYGRRYLHVLSSPPWVADIVTLFMLPCQILSVPETTLNNLVAVFLFIVPFTIAIKSALDNRRRIDMVVFWGGVCGALLSVLATHGTITGYWLHLIPVAYALTMAILITAPKEVQDFDTLFAGLGKALVYSMLWATSPQIANFMDVPDSVRLIGVLFIVAISARSSMSFTLLLLVVVGQTMPPSALVIHRKCCL